MRSHDHKKTDNKTSAEKVVPSAKDAEFKSTLSEISMFKKIVFMEPILGDRSPIPPPPLKVSLGAPNMPPIQVKEFKRMK